MVKFQITYPLAALCYLAGALTVAGAVFEAGGRPSVAMFALGVFTPVLILATTLSSRTRLQRVALKMLALAGRPEREYLNRVTLGTQRRNSTPAAASPFEKDVISALMNFGATKREAAAAARAATQAHPGADFDTLCRAAFQYSGA